MKIKICAICDQEYKIKREHIKDDLHKLYINLDKMDKMYQKIKEFEEVDFITKMETEKIIID